MESNDKINRLLFFLQGTIEYFLNKIQFIDKDKYFADRDIRNILDKTINDIILCVIDLSEELLKKNNRNIPDTYRDTVLACHEFLGDVVLKIAPLTKHRNETIHEYLKINWQNVVTIKNKISDIQTFAEKIKVLL
ncbi:DUF86 domain-containing protein [Candidatus Poribacteria bacterium]|nr:DUF86 domain-containing protein [Candidatus Poribacteria bacterium]